MVEGLRFDKAEYAGGETGTGCSVCLKPLGVQYYTLNGNAICSRCRSRLERESNGGSRAGRLLRATVFGFAAGAVGTALWYGVRAATGYEFGLLAIVVGFGVGTAVRAGSRGRGGWAYQALAMFLTYGSIVSTYVPDIVQALGQQAEQESNGAATAAPAESAEEVQLASFEGDQAPAEGGGAVTAQHMGVGQGVLALGVAAVFLLALAFAVPFFGGVENIMGIIIIGIALYEAWKINRKLPAQIAGPYRLGGGQPPAIGA
jgi:hypothetical protein